MDKASWYLKRWMEEKAVTEENLANLVFANRELQEEINELRGQYEALKLELQLYKQTENKTKEDHS